MSTHIHQTLLPGWHVPVNPVLVRALGYLEAYVLSQIWYWEQNPQSEGWLDDNGISWVYNSAKKWAQQLGLTQSQARHVLDKLRKLKVVFTKKLQAKRWVQDLHYRVNVERVLELVSQAHQECETAKAKEAKTRKASKSSAFAKSSNSMSEDSQNETQNSADDLTNTSSDTSSHTTPDVAVVGMQSEEKELLHQLVELGVHASQKQQIEKCLHLIRTYGSERIKRQLEYESLRPKADSAPARLVAAIKADYAPPVQAQQAQESEQAAADKAEKKSAIAAFLEKAREAVELVIESSGARYVIEHVNPSGGIDLRDGDGNVASVPVGNLLGRAQLVLP